MNRDFLSGAAALALSLSVNAAAFYAVDHTAIFHGINAHGMMRVLRAHKDDDELRFEFVEAPPKTHPRKPENTSKIASRDALNQDAAGAPTTDASSAPAIQAKGVADQLAQQRTAAVSAPPPPKVEPPKEEKPPVPEAPPKEDLAEKIVPSPEDFPSKPQEKQVAKQEPAPPSVDSKGLSGQSRITTQEMARSKSTGAALFGLTSFEATGSGMGEYMKNLKERIWLTWYPYIAFKYPLDFKTADAVVSITLDKEGRVAIVKVVESSGSPVFASFCVKAVQAASPFGPLPSEILALIGKDELEIKFGFHYH